MLGGGLSQPLPLSTGCAELPERLSGFPCHREKLVPSVGGSEKFPPQFSADSECQLGTRRLLPHWLILRWRRHHPVSRRWITAPGLGPGLARQLLGRRSKGLPLCRAPWFLVPRAVLMACSTARSARKGGPQEHADGPAQGPMASAQGCSAGRLVYTAHSPATAMAIGWPGRHHRPTLKGTTASQANRAVLRPRAAGGNRYATSSCNDCRCVLDQVFRPESSGLDSERPFPNRCYQVDLLHYLREFSERYIWKRYLNRRLALPVPIYILVSLLVPHKFI